MDKISRIEKEWIQSLGSGNSDLALTALYEIRNAGSMNMLPYLFKLIHRETPRDIRTEILKLLGEIKWQEAVPMIAASLDEMDYGEYLPAFVAACWQSGLDFSSHLIIFARLFIHGDYITSLEAFTLLEESIPNATDHARLECIQYIRDSEYLVQDEKLPLFREMRKVIESI
jgi:hypothetical protein